MKVLLAVSGMWNDRKTLAAVRSLRQAGFHVTVCGDSQVGQPLYSRFTNARVRLPGAFQDPGSFADALLTHLRRRRYDFLLPMCDLAASAVSSRLEDFLALVRTPVPPYEIYDRGSDKWETLKIARSLGIPTPLSFCVHDERELLEAAQRLSYPCVLKLRKGAGANYLSYPRDREHLLACFRGLPADPRDIYDFSAPILQEYIPGPIHDVSLLFNHGRLQGAMTSRRILTHPHTGGIGVYNDTTREPALLEQGVALLKALQWHGPAEVEFKMDPRDGLPKLMEINTRFWGSLDLAIQAGIDFPVLACRMLLQDDLQPVLDYRVGLRYRWPVPFGAARFLTAPGKLRSFWKIFGFTPGSRSDIWLSDPFPHLAEIFWTSPSRIESRRSHTKSNHGKEIGSHASKH